MNFKMNKTKLIARMMLLVLLVTSAFSFVGCAEKGKYMYISTCTQVGGINSVAYISDTEFDIANVNVNLYYGVHELNYLGQISSNPKENFPEIYQNCKFILSICVCNAIHKYEAYKGECCVELKTVSEEELFSKDFGYIDTPFFISNGVIFMHGENIQIPSEMFDKDSGTVHLLINLFTSKKNTIETGNNMPLVQSFINLRYQKKDNDKIVLSGYRQ